MPTTITIIGSVLLLSEMYASFQFILTPRFSKTKTVLLLALSCAVAHTGYFFPYLSDIRILIPNLVAVLIIIVTYKDKWIKTILVYLTVLILEVLVEFTNILLRSEGAMASWPDGFSVREQISMYAMFMFSLGILLTIFIFIFKKYSRSSPEFFKTKESGVFTALMVVEIFIVAGIFKIVCEDLSKNRFILLLAIILSIVVVNIAVFYSFASISRRLQEENRASTLEQLVQAQAEYYSALSEQHENIRNMRHDIANHILAMKLLLKENKDAEVSDYLDDLQERYKSHSELGNCQNSVVDAFVYHKICRLREENIPVTYHIVLPENVDISNTDLISAFGNLIDNCAEACAAAENPSVNISAAVRSGYLRIETENPVPAVAQEEKARRIPELERGIGTHILKALAEKYNGRFETDSENGIYKTELILKASD